MKRKIIALCLIVAMLGVAVISGSLAYFTDTAEAVNVMTIGSVKIEQIESEWDNGQLVAFTNNKPLLPYVGELGWANTDTDGGAFRSFTMNNVVDKIVQVKNIGRSDAYVRTIFAFEVGEYTSVEDLWYKVIATSFNAENGNEYKFDGTWNWTERTDDMIVTLNDGHKYLIVAATHKDAVEPGETTIPSLLQIYMNKAATNEMAEKLDGNKNGTYDIPVITQAVQASGFEDVGADKALTEAFGELTETNIQEWFADTLPGVLVKVEGNNKTAVLAAIENAKDGDTIVLSEDTTIAGYGATEKLVIDKAITLDLNGKTITTECGWGGIDAKGGCSIINGTINHTGNTAAIKAFQVETIENVTINVTQTAGKTKGGIVVQNGQSSIGSIKNVTINGATNGIECYNSANSQAIGSMENVKINATQNGIYLNGAGQIGKISGCEIYGGSHGINAYLANLWHISLDIENSKISGGNYGIDIWDEAKVNTGSTVTFNYDAATTFSGNTSNIKITLQDEITCKVNGTEQATPCDVRY